MISPTILSTNEHQKSEFHQSIQENRPIKSLPPNSNSGASGNSKREVESERFQQCPHSEKGNPKTSLNVPSSNFLHLTCNSSVSLSRRRDKRSEKNEK
jgi:hypothetical protein